MRRTGQQEFGWGIKITRGSLCIGDKRTYKIDRLEGAKVGLNPLYVCSIIAFGLFFGAINFSDILAGSEQFRLIMLALILAVIGACTATLDLKSKALGTQERAMIGPVWIVRRVCAALREVFDEPSRRRVRKNISDHE